MNTMKTTVVGSYPIPEWLKAYPTEPNLKDAILTVLKIQELVGLDVVSDGELGRFDISHPETNGMIDYFVRKLGGVETALTRGELESWLSNMDMAFRKKPAGIVREDLHEGYLNLNSDWSQVSSLSIKPQKFTVTSPYMLARTLYDVHYKDVEKLTHALADILARQIKGIDASIIQVDEAHLTGHPDDKDWVVDPINKVLDSIQQEKALHLCFGNYGGQPIQKGIWKDLIPFFNQLHVDHLVLEFARRGYRELDAFLDLREDIKLGLGVIDIKDNEVESADVVAERIEHAVDVLGGDRVQWLHPDCGFWMLPRSVADRKMRILVEGRDLFIGGHPKPSQDD